MNGRALPWDRVRKNKKTGVFAEIGHRRRDRSNPWVTAQARSVLEAVGRM